jgi:aminoglycoside phosphotransferase family enzyme/predicted kinase
MSDGQREVIEFLRDPHSYSPPVQRVDVIETHASIVFLAGDYAYKLKRAVKYPYLDYSTVAKRQAFCAAELRLNRRTAPELYLEVAPIWRRDDGRPEWGRPESGQGGSGEPIDFVVVMRRFDQRDVLDAVAQHDGLSSPLLQALSAHIAAFHAAAEIHPESGGAVVMGEVADTAISVLRSCRVPAGFAAEQIDLVARTLKNELMRIAGLLDARRAAGKVRLCHGDLHLRNVCLMDGMPRLFDCIDFSAELSQIDVLYDLAFLLMDLDHRGLAGAANLVLNRYLDLTEEEDGLAVLPSFIALRAVIRSHITATMAQHGWGDAEPATQFGEARRYLDEAEKTLDPVPACMIAIGGVSGTGKSTLAAALAPELGPRPGARVLRSDVLRKLQFGASPESPLPPEAYAADVTARVYGDLRTRAAVALAGGYSVVIDAVSLRAEERRAFAAAAEAAGVPFTGLWLEAPAELLEERVAARHGDASDATAAIVQQQLQIEPGPIDWVRIDASGGPSAILATARRALVHRP